jgi:hypothetical protein
MMLEWWFARAVAAVIVVRTVMATRPFRRGAAAMRVPVALVTALLTVAGVSAQDQVPITDATDGSCDRSCLTRVLDSYFQSLADRNVALMSTSVRVRVTENAVDVRLGAGLWQRGAVASFRIDALDPENGQAASTAVIAEQGKPAIEFVRLKVEQLRIVEIETIIVRPGEGQRSDPDNMARFPDVFSEILAPAQRGTRAGLIDAADSYLDALAASGRFFVPPPIADEAIRVENGLQTSGVARGDRPAVSLADQLRRAPERSFLPPGSRVAGRRYPVVDLEKGIVVVVGTMTLQLPPGVADGPPLHANPATDGMRLQVLVEFFKVADGKIQRIQAVMYDLDDPQHPDPGWPV